MEDIAKLIEHINQLEEQLLEKEEDVRDAEEARDRVDNELYAVYRSAAKLLPVGGYFVAGRYVFTRDPKEPERLKRVFRSEWEEQTETPTPPGPAPGTED